MASQNCFSPPLMVPPLLFLLPKDFRACPSRSRTSFFLTKSRFKNKIWVRTVGELWLRIIQIRLNLNCLTRKRQKSLPSSQLQIRFTFRIRQKSSKLKKNTQGTKSESGISKISGGNENFSVVLIFSQKLLQRFMFVHWNTSYKWSHV